MEKLNSDLAKEILTVISYLEDNLINQLSNDFLSKLVDLAADSNKDFVRRLQKLDFIIILSK